MRVFSGLLAFTLLVMMVLTGPERSEATNKSPIKPKSALNLKMKSDFLDKIRNLEFKGFRWDNLTNLMSKFKFQNHREMNDEGEELPNIPNPSINEPLNATMIEQLDSTVFITQFFNYILTGRFDGVTIIGDNYDLLTLDAILGLGIQLYVSIVTLEDPVPDYAFGSFFIHWLFLFKVELNLIKTLGFRCCGRFGTNFGAIACEWLNSCVL